MAEPAPVINQAHPCRFDPPQRHFPQRLRQSRNCGIPHKWEPRGEKVPAAFTRRAPQSPATSAELRALNLLPLLSVALNRSGHQAGARHRSPVAGRGFRQHVQIQLIVHCIKQRRRVRCPIRFHHGDGDHLVVSQKVQQSFAHRQSFPQSWDQFICLQAAVSIRGSAEPHKNNVASSAVAFITVSRPFALKEGGKRRMKQSLFIFMGCATAFWLGAVAASHAAIDQPQDAIFAVTEENDSFGSPPGPHQDRHYTQGLKFAYRAGDNDFRNATAALSAALPTFAIDPSAADLGFVFGQNIYTPTNLQLKNPDPNDRPYAGWLYGGVFLQRRGLTAGSIPVLESFEADLGIVGPGSLGGTMQKSWHEMLHIDTPKGWDHQLKTEPGLEIKYARLWRLTAESRIRPLLRSYSVRRRECRQYPGRRQRRRHAAGRLEPAK